MQHSLAFKPGWLREEIKASVENLVNNPRVSQTQKEAFRIAAEKLQSSRVLKRANEAPDAGNNPSINATPDH
jgi:hypothetical protein